MARIKILIVEDEPLITEDLRGHLEEMEYEVCAVCDNALDAMAEMIAWLSQELDAQFNIELVYLIMPNKYSIYGKDIDPDYVYDGFIPAVQERLAAWGIPYIDAYGAYQAYRSKDDGQLLYYHSDTHFTPFGKQVVLNEILRYLRP